MPEPITAISIEFSYVFEFNLPWAFPCFRADGKALANHYSIFRIRMLIVIIKKTNTVRFCKNTWNGHKNSNIRKRNSSTFKASWSKAKRPANNKQEAHSTTDIGLFACGNLSLSPEGKNVVNNSA